MIFDIFGVPMYSTDNSRRREFSRMVVALTRTGLYKDCQVDFIRLTTFVRQGYLSPMSASYFMCGKATSLQVFYFNEFARFLEDFVTNNGFSFSKISALWLNSKLASEAQENTFLFPLEVQDSKVVVEQYFDDLPAD